jgi:hypothetical protein
LHAACRRHGFQFRYEKHGERNSVEPVFEGKRPPRSRTASVTPREKLSTSGCERSHGTGFPEHCPARICRVSLFKGGASKPLP